MSGAALAPPSPRDAAAGLDAPAGRRRRPRLPAWPAALATGLAVPAAALALWALAARGGWLPPQILPAPELVLETFADLWRAGDILENAGVSLARVLQGFALGGLAGLALGAAMALSRPVEQTIRPTFLAFAQVPTIGWVPLLMLPLGIGEPLKVVIIAKAAMVPVALNALDGIRAVPRGWLEVGAVYRYGRAQLLRRIVLPAAVPPVFTGVRYGLTNCWKALVAVELLASSEGLGHLLVWGRQMFQMDVVLATIAVIAAVGYALDLALAAGERRLQRWREAGR
jgi:sulfonate transport system permease protein